MPTSRPTAFRLIHYSCDIAGLCFANPLLRRGEDKICSGAVDIEQYMRTPFKEHRQPQLKGEHAFEVWRVQPALAGFEMHALQLPALIAQFRYGASRDAITTASAPFVALAIKVGLQE